MLSQRQARTVLAKKVQIENMSNMETPSLLPARAYIIYEYCSKMDLFTYVAEGSTMENEKLCHALFFQIIHSLNFMHLECSVAHLDVKLENIVIDKNYFLKLIDFAYCEGT